MEGIIIDAKGITVRQASSLHGNMGELDELVIPDPESQVLVDKVYGVNPSL